ncbi:MAG: choice-of-anchor D domain-containing protein [Ignavibacteria bacterium]|nr:choice-of-anchor D domain-containing protein [Ignavibacteria bacterium]
MRIPSNNVPTAAIFWRGAASIDGDVTGNNGSMDYWVVKLNPAGAIEWQKALGGSSTEHANSIQQSTDGGYIVAGVSASKNGDVTGNNGNDDYWVVKLSPTGAIDWQRSLGGSLKDVAHSIQQSNDGGYIVAGESGSTDGDVTGNNGNDDYWVVKLSPIGAIEWQKSLGGSNYDRAHSIQQSTDGGYIVAGVSTSIDGDVTGNIGSEDYWVVKLSSTGTIEWQKSLAGSNEDFAYSIHQSADGGYIVAGESYSNNGDVSGNHGASDYWVVKLSPEGVAFQSDTSDAVFSIISPEPTLQNLSIDMVKVLVGQSKDSTVLGIICNKGLAPLHVLGIDITSGDSVDFTIPRGAGDFFLDSNECRDVMFGFAPTKVGVRTAKATIRTTVGDFTDTISIIGEGVAPSLAIVTPFIDFGQTFVGKPKDSTKVITIKNVGSSDMTISQIDYNAVNTTNFSTLTGGNSFTLKPNEQAIMDLRFLPSDVGRKSGILQFHYNGVGSPATVQLFGEGIATLGIIPSILATSTIPFDSVCIGHPESRSATIKNNGNVPLQLIRAEWITNAANVFSTTVSPQLLAVDSSITVPIDFLPIATGMTNGQVRWIADKDTAVSSVSGIGKVCTNIPDTARTTVIAQDISAQAGEKVNLSLKLIKSTGMQVTGAPTDWYARIHYNKSILFNEQTNNVCPGTTDSCVLELTGVYNPKSDELISIPSIATLGNTDHSSIIIDEFKWTNSAIVTDVATQYGTIRITGTCEDGGVRLFIPANSSTSLSTRPNPAQDNLQIQYGLREPLIVTLELLTLTGQVVQTIVNNQSQATGQYTLTSDLSLLGNGVYLLRLRTNKEMLTTRVDVVK